MTRDVGDEYDLPRQYHYCPVCLGPHRNDWLDTAVHLATYLLGFVALEIVLWLVLRAVI